MNKINEKIINDNYNFDLLKENLEKIINMYIYDNYTKEELVKDYLNQI